MNGGKKKKKTQSVNTERGCDEREKGIKGKNRGSMVYGIKRKRKKR